MDFKRFLVGSLVTVPAFLLPSAVAGLPAPEAWEIGPVVNGRNFSVGMPARPNAGERGGVSFEFPRRGGEIDALTTNIGPLSGAQEITIVYRIDASRNTAFVPAETPGDVATVSIYFQQGGDTWTARGRYASYRWYVPGRAVTPLAPGRHAVTVKLDEPWTNVNGKTSTQDPAGFAQALERTASLGLAFGTSSARSHGVYATGPARFTLLALTIR